VAANSFQYDFVFNASKAVAETAKFAKATQNAIDKTIKKNGKLDRSLVVQRKQLVTARREYAKYSEGKHKDASAADAAAHKHKKLTKEIGKTTDKIRRGKRAIAEHRRELEKLQKTADKGIKIKPTRNQYPAPISPQRPGSPVMGPGGPGRRGFAGQVGNRAGFVRGARNLGAQGAAGFSALGGAAGGGGLLAPLASGFAIQQSISGAVDLDSQTTKLRVLSEQYGDYNSILKIIDSSASTFNKSQREATTEFANVYARLRPLGVELHQIKGVYEGFNAVAIASGATSEATRIAFMQLSQAIGSGRLAGDEFRSVSEQIPGVLIPIAKEMGVTVGELKKLGSEGKITSDVLIRSLSGSFALNKEKIKQLLAEQPAAKFKAFSNAVSDLAVAVGDALLPAVLPLVEALTKALRFIIDLPAPIRNVGLVAGTAAIGVIALAGAFKTLGIGVGVKFVGGLAAAALGIKGMGLAAMAAMPKLLLLKKTLLSLGAIGLITLAINVVIDGLDKLTQLEKRFKGIEAFGSASDYVKSVGGSALSKEELDKLITSAENQLKTDAKRGGVKDANDVIAGNFRDEPLNGFDDAARQAVLSGRGRIDALKRARSSAIYATPADRQVEDEARAAEKLRKAQEKAGKAKGSGRDIAGQLAKANANNALRLTQKKAQIALKVARDEYALRTELEQSNQQLQESNLVGIARQQQAILNARIQAFRGLEVREQRLEDEVTNAEQRLAAAELRLTQATGPVDAARAQGTVSNAQADLSGAQQNLGNFRQATPTLVNNLSQSMSAQSTETLRQQTEQTLLQVQALRHRNELLARGVSPEVLEGEMAKLEIDRSTAVQLQQLNADRLTNATAIRDIKLAAEEAKGAIDQLTEAQQNGSNAIREYISTSMEFVSDVQGRIVEIASTIEQSIGSAIQGVVDGTLTASEAFGQFFANVGKSFLQMATQIIAKLIVIQLLKTAIGLFGGGGMPDGVGLGDGVNGKVANNLTGQKFGTLGPNFGIPQLAKGGIVTGPTTALIGEGGMNEAVVPLPNGKAIPVDMRGASGGNVNSNVTVNVTNDGSSSDSDPNGPAKLGKAIDTAVRKVIMDERRSGGLLSSAR
jgi:tape measure domain-containing protein